MLHDLATAGSERVDRQVQVCVIGAGTAGLFLAQQLRARGVHVLVVETGGTVSRSAASVGQRCEQHGIFYRGAESGRAFGLGGTSVLWGGQFIPLTPSDLSERRAVGFEAWPISYSELKPFFSETRRVLGLVSELDTDARVRARFCALSTLDPEFSLRVSEWLPFHKRNFAHAFAQLVHQDETLELWLNAQVSVLDVVTNDSGFDLRELTANGPNGQQLRVHAEHVVVSAGALESTRLLLEVEEALAARGHTNSSPCGHYFADHLSVNVAKFRCNNWRALNHAVAPVFQRGIMRTPRLELTAAAQEREKLTSAFAHFTFVTDGNSGFDVVRSWLRRRQGEQVAASLSPCVVAKAGRDIAALGYWKTVHRRLWIPRDAELLLQLDIEQSPNWHSRLSLSDERDQYGRKRLAIDWRILPEDLRVIRAVSEKIRRAWRRGALGHAAELVPEPIDELAEFATLYDVYHPTGCLRMGAEPKDSVVDKDLRLWGFRNCYVSSTAVFPSAGSANPGYTHLALTARLAEHLVQQLAV